MLALGVHRDRGDHAPGQAEGLEQRGEAVAGRTSHRSATWLLGAYRPGAAVRLGDQAL